MTTNVVFPGEFNPKTDKWDEYKERLWCALDALDAREGHNLKARSLFLSQCGKDTYSLIASLLVPKRPTEVPLEDIIDVLDKFYGPEINEIIQAGKFHLRRQMPQETVQDFVAGLSQLAAKCNFGDLQRQMRDRLVLGVRDVRLRRDLLRAAEKSKDLTYQAALQMCLNYQASFADLYPKETGESDKTHQGSTETMEIDRVQGECRRCARAHGGSQCPFVKARCFFCKKVGHIASACERRGKTSKVNDVEDTQPTDKETDSAENMMGIYVCADGYRRPITAAVTINGATLSMEVDSGASRTIMSEETYNRLWPTPPPLKSTNIKLVTWTKDPLKVLGLANVEVKLGDRQAQCELVVVSGKGPNLLGRSWFPALGVEVVGLHWSIEEMKQEFPEIFATGLGEYKGPAVSLHVREGATPRFLRARPVPFPIKQQVEDQLQSMVASGVLTPVRYSEWATPLRIVPKEDGSVRICGDYRATVNAAIDTDKYPLPTSAEAFVKLSGGKIFSKLDLKAAYTQLAVTEETAMLLTLNTPIGLMRMNRLAFGVSAAPAIFQRVMSTALAGMEGVACLLDDIAVAGKTKEEHDHRLRKVMQKLQEMGLRLNLDKCVFASKSVTFLGHVIDAEGLHPSPAKVDEIKNKPAPTNRETLRAFLGLYNFYEKFLPDKSTILEPLYRLLESKRQWQWGVDEQKAFEAAKNLLSSDLTLVGYDLEKELLVICDSSDYGVGAVLAHIMEDGSERPVMMASRTLQPHERRYGQIDKEALAIIFGVTKFHEYLAGRQFCIVTDHKPLVGLLNPERQIPEQISPRMLRWSLKLACYKYTIKYRPGKLIGNADALSRWTEPETSAMINEKALPEVLLLQETNLGQINALTVAQETKKDPLLTKVIFHTQHGWPRTNSDPALQPFWTRRNALSLNKDCLLWSNRVIIPDKLKNQVLKLLHDPHAGMVQTKAFARGYVWWPDMDQQIEQVVSQCEQCQLVRNNPPKNPQSWIVSEKPWSRVHVDFAGPFMGKTFLVLIDSHSKWFEAEIVNSMASATVINVLRKIFATQGLPEVLVSDNGRAFSSEEFNTFLKKNGIKHLYSPPYHPETNGQIERAIATFKNKIKKMMTPAASWQEMLPRVLYSLRTVPNSSTNRTPAEILNGRKYRTAVSVLHPECVESRAEQERETAAQRPAGRQFKLNQPVLVHMYGPGEKWCRGTVEMVEGPSTYRVRTEDGELHRRHADQLLARAIRPPSQPDLDTDPAQSNARSDPDSEPDPPIVIPDPALWRDIIGIPDE